MAKSMNVIFMFYKFPGFFSQILKKVSFFLFFFEVCNFCLFHCVRSLELGIFLNQVNYISIIVKKKMGWDGLEQLFFVCFLELQAPTITPAFSSPLSVMESESVTLEWTYNLHGVDFSQMEFSIQGGAFVVQKFQTNVPFIAAIFNGRVANNITESFASIKFLSMNRTDSRTYTLSVVNANGEQTFDTVEIQVLCK